MLKFTVSIALIFCFLTQSLSKLIIVLNYQINKEFITKNICVNRNKPKSCCKGKCELKKQLDADDKKDNVPANTNKDKFEKEDFCQVIKTNVFDLARTADLNCKFISHKTKEFPIFVFHPPQS